MNRKTTFGVLLALAAAPAVVVPRLVPAAQAQAGTLAVPGTPAAGADRAEYPDVPRNHWAYQAIDRLSRAGIIEGYPNGTFTGARPMTRYEFAVAIARILDKIPTGPGGTGPQGAPGAAGAQGETGPAGVAGTVGPGPDMNNYLTKQQVNDLIAALRKEFADELARLGARVDALDTRLTAVENRVPQAPRVTITPSLLWRGGVASYISQVATPGTAHYTGDVPGRTIMAGGNVFSNPSGTLGGPFVGALPAPPSLFMPTSKIAYTNAKYSYTDFELRLTDRVTDRLSANAALRAIGSTQEDPWGPATNGLWAREAFVRADLSDRSWLGIKGLSATLGRQRTKIGQGLLYDNGLSPTDQANVSFNLGPVAIGGFWGTTNNETFAGGANPYLMTGAVANMGTSLMGAPGQPAVGTWGGPGGLFYRGAGAGVRAQSGAAVGFPSMAGSGALMPEDNESLLRASMNLFKISGQPVSLGLSRQFDGVQNQQGDSLDLTVPLFNRTIGIEWVRQRRYANAAKTIGNPSAYNVTVPLYRANWLDLNLAYGKAGDDFEYMLSSSANPYARTYAEALFDRPMALGAPMINGRFFSRTGSPTGMAGAPAYATAKEAWDWNGTVRIPLGFLRRIPLDFRYYRAYGTRLAPGGHKNALDLGDVYSVGSTFNVTPGLDLELKYGHYRVPGPYPSIYYVRLGANVGF